MNVFLCTSTDVEYRKSKTKIKNRQVCGDSQITVAHHHYSRKMNNNDCPAKMTSKFAKGTGIADGPLSPSHYTSDVIKKHTMK